jgi:ABC-type dipeptide/oligopeptide/nickel transport system permease component
MGRTLITAIRSYDFPVIQSFTAMFAALFIVTNILTDVLYALVDPRVRLS